MVLSLRVPPTFNLERLHPAGNDVALAERDRSPAVAVSLLESGTCRWSASQCNGRSHGRRTAPDAVADGVNFCHWPETVVIQVQMNCS